MKWTGDHSIVVFVFLLLFILIGIVMGHAISTMYACEDQVQQIPGATRFVIPRSLACVAQLSDGSLRSLE